MESLEAQRRAIGTDMVAERTGKQVQQAINQLTARPVSNQGLKSLESKGKQDAKRGRGNYTAPSTSGSGGIASPLVEATRRVESADTTETLREYYDRSTALYTNDLLLAVEIRPLKSLTMLDASGAEVVFKFAQPKSIE